MKSILPIMAAIALLNPSLANAEQKKLEHRA